MPTRTSTPAAYDGAEQWSPRGGSASAESLSQQPAAPHGTETARMLHTLLGNLEGMVYRCRDDADWTMEFVSEGSLQLTGYRPEELLRDGRVSYETITHPEDRDRVRREIQRPLPPEQLAALLSQGGVAASGGWSEGKSATT